VNSPALFLLSTIVYELFKSCGIIATHVLLWMMNLATREGRVVAQVRKRDSASIPRTLDRKGSPDIAAAPLLESMSMTDRPPMPLIFV
jgi:hypothetical protein